MKYYLFSCLLLICLVANAQKQTADSLAALADQHLDKSLPLNYNPKKGFNLYQQSATLGNARAMNAVAMCYQLGIGTETNPQKAEEWFLQAANAGYPKAWYNLGLTSKGKLNLEKAYLNFSKAAELGDVQGIYAQGYMLYKGFGCIQNYTQAADLFKKGVALGKANCMYFLGLCYRNGYGIIRNTDSARYWLLQATNNGWNVANDELASNEPERVTIANTLASNIKAAREAMPSIDVVNKYKRVEHQIAVSDVAGIYAGYLLKYDWSGQHVIEATPLQVNLNYRNDSLVGSWQEGDSLQIPLRASLTPKALVFGKMQYRKSNHYSPKGGELTVFEKAHLQLTKANNAVYLAGNLQQFVPGRNEPAKPMFVALVRNSGVSSKQMLNVVNEDGSLLSSKPLLAYPNPFGSSLTVDFELTEAAHVTTQISTLQGNIVYSNVAGILSPGHYTLPIQTQQIAAGYYVAMVKYGKKAFTTKIVKL